MTRPGLLLALLVAPAARPADPAPPTADETRAFMKKLAGYVADNHMKRDEKSPQRGMVYEYFDVAKRGQPDQWVQGEALDTMHDGAFFALALATAHKATGDPFYKDLLTKWVLPFYVKVLNHSDELFSPDKDDVSPKGHKFDREHQLQKGEKGFCPYWWDDGASVSLEQRRGKSRDLFFSGTNNLAGKDNPLGKLDGYSHGSSNHMAQDLGIMLQGCWLLLKDSKDDADRKLASEVAEAAKNLHECRMRHHGVIPAVAAAAALTNNDAELIKKVGELKFTPPSNHYTRFLSALDGDKRQATPGFMDDAEYTFYSQTAKSGTLTDAAAFKLIYDAFTEPMLFRYWSDDAEVPPGMNRFDLSPLYGKNGKFETYRSDRPIGMGSRMGPQTMVVCGWALQALKAKPGLWDEAVKKLAGEVAVVDVNLGQRPDLETKFRFKAGDLWVSSRPDRLTIFLRRIDKTVLALYEGDPKTGRLALTLNDGKEFSHFSHLSLATEGATAQIRYTVVKGGDRWLSGVQLGRYAIRFGEETQPFVLASREADVRKALERELAGGLRTWMKVFEEKGYIPTGIGAGKDWDGLSDTGGYAHLLKAGALYLMLLEGKQDWSR